MIKEATETPEAQEAAETPEVQESTINIEGDLQHLMPSSEEFYYPY